MTYTYNNTEHFYKNFSFYNHTFETYYNWGHRTRLYYKDHLLIDTKIIYLNRTWECYKFQSVMKKAVSIEIEYNEKQLKEQFKRQQNIKRLTKKYIDQFNEYLNNASYLNELKECYKAL